MHACTLDCNDDAPRPAPSRLVTRRRRTRRISCAVGTRQVQVGSRTMKQTRRGGGGPKPHLKSVSQSIIIITYLSAGKKSHQRGQARSSKSVGERSEALTHLTLTLYAYALRCPMLRAGHEGVIFFSQGSRREGPPPRGGWKIDNPTQPSIAQPSAVPGQRAQGKSHRSPPAFTAPQAGSC
jgi:hypothetical protein